MTKQIEIFSKVFSAQELEELVRSQLPTDHNSFVLEVTKKTRKYRSLDQTVLVAIIGGTGATLAVLLTCLTTILQEKLKKGIIVIQGEKRRIEIPANTSPERIRDLIELAKEIDTYRIEFVSGKAKFNED